MKQDVLDSRLVLVVMLRLENAHDFRFSNKLSFFTWLNGVLY